ncbi:MAG: ABC transporter permease [Muribaculaceae bacterium]|nr:ABC transporter permease [Muribaculaceae bacterium]
MIDQLKLIVQTEYLTDIRSKGFWIGTFIVPIIVIAFGGICGVLMAQSDSFANTINDLPTQPDPNEMTAAKAIGMMAGIFLTFFLMIYGAMIFNKVKAEKCNRIMEIICTSVPGKTLMLGKILSVGLTGLTQLLIWGLLIFAGVTVFFIIFGFDVPWHYLTAGKTYLAITWTLLYFIGGYVLFGSLYAACGAITDKDNENQAYMTVITFVLLGAFYLGQFAVDNGDSTLAVICSYIPFTSPTVGTVAAVSGVAPIWQTVTSLAVLYFADLICVGFAGKLYRSSMLLKGKQFTPKDLVVFLRS